MTPYYDEDGITLYHGAAEDVLPTLDVGIDLVFTSPPYNLGNSSGGGLGAHYRADAPLGKRGGNGRWARPALAAGYGKHNDSMPHEEYVAWQHTVLRECWRLLSPTGEIFYNHKQRVFSGEVITPLVYNPGLPVRQIVIWARAGGINCAPTHYCPTHEWLVVLARPEFRLKSKAASSIGDVWYVPQGANTEHPAPFPLGLPARAIETVSPAVVLDPFAGSGTTLRAAKNAGARAIGIELDEQWCDLAVRKLAQGVLAV